MLLDFRIKNYRSYKDETRFNMTTVKSFKELNESNVIKVNREFDLLKSATVFGANASGKSNLVKAFAFISNIIFNSYRISLSNKKFGANRDIRFKLSSESDTEPSLFEITFLNDGIIYRYGFEIDNDRICKEWLYYKIERETPLFIRENQTFTINEESFPEGNEFKTLVNDNVLFLSYLGQHNQPYSSKILKWFTNINVISSTSESYYQDYTLHLLQKNSNFKKWTSYALQYLEISNIQAVPSNNQILTHHNKFDNNNILIETIPFEPAIQSDGTRKLINLLGPIYDTLKNGKILVVDEFDSKLHPNLSKKLFDFFHQYNHNGAQFIFTCQDSSLLDKDLLRRDQIWFVQKDQFGSSELYSMSEFDSTTVRNTSAYDKKYLNNLFGGAGTIKNMEKLSNLLYNG